MKPEGRSLLLLRDGCGRGVCQQRFEQQGCLSRILQLCGWDQRKERDKCYCRFKIGFHWVISPEKKIIRTTLATVTNRQEHIHETQWKEAAWYVKQALSAVIGRQRKRTTQRLRSVDVILDRERKTVTDYCVSCLSQSQSATCFQQF